MDTDRTIGRSIARHRQKQGWTQQQLADQMRKRGWPWTQQMVGKIEKGLRPVRFAEAGELAALMRVTTQDLLLSPLDAAVREVRIQRAQARTVLERTKERAHVLEALSAASKGAEMQLSDPESSLAFAFWVPVYDWGETLEILTYLGATDVDLEPIKSLAESALARQGDSLPVGRALWELLQRLLPTLHSAEE